MSSEWWIVFSDPHTAAKSQNWNCTRAVWSQRNCMEQNAGASQTLTARKLIHSTPKTYGAYSKFSGLQQSPTRPSLSDVILTPFQTSSWGTAGRGGWTRDEIWAWLTSQNSSSLDSQGRPKTTLRRTFEAEMKCRNVLGLSEAIGAGTQGVEEACCCPMCQEA